MLPGYRAVLALTLAAACTLGLAYPAAASGPRKPRPVSVRAMPSPRDLYSPRALRRARIILQLQLLELRAERLERVRKAIERNMPVDRLIRQP